MILFLSEVNLPAEFILVTCVTLVCYYCIYDTFFNPDDNLLNTTLAETVM